MNKIREREILTKKLMENGRSQIGQLSEREKFIAGIALYFAEGSKLDKQVVFSNSNSKAIKFMTEWLRNFCKVPNNKFRLSIYIHDNLDEQRAKIFWSKLTNINISQFTKNYIVKNNIGRYRKTINEYGVCRITICNVNLQRTIMGWISGLIGI